MPRVEPYSTDEFFLDLDVPGDVVVLAYRLRDDVRRLAKIPTCVGVGSTKTLAKLANGLAKDRAELGSVCNQRDPDARAAVFADLPVDEVWGTGGATVAKLRCVGVRTVAEFIAMDSELARDMLTVVGGRVQAELRGVSCLPCPWRRRPGRG